MERSLQAVAEESMQDAYLTLSDVRAAFSDETVIALKAPAGTTLDAIVLGRDPFDIMMMVLLADGSSEPDTGEQPQDEPNIAAPSMAVGLPLLSLEEVRDSALCCPSPPTRTPETAHTSL